MFWMIALLSKKWSNVQRYPQSFVLRGSLDEQPDLTEGFQKKMAFKNIHIANYFYVKTIQNGPSTRSGIDQK